MKIAWAFVFVAVFSASRMQAECSEGFMQQGIQCADTNGNICQAYLNQPVGGQDGVYVACGSISCCGQLQVTCWANGPCNHALKNRKSREQVAALASSSEVLVADCSGSYVLYVQTSTRTSTTTLRERL
jgi:hypothetical protein